MSPPEDAYFDRPLDEKPILKHFNSLEFYSSSIYDNKCKQQYVLTKLRTTHYEISDLRYNIPDDKIHYIDL